VLKARVSEPGCLGLIPGPSTYQLICKVAVNRVCCGVKKTRSLGKCLLYPKGCPSELSILSQKRALRPGENKSPRLQRQSQEENQGRLALEAALWTSCTLPNNY